MTDTEVIRWVETALKCPKCRPCLTAKDARKFPTFEAAVRMLCVLHSVHLISDSFQGTAS